MYPPPALLHVMGTQHEDNDYLSRTDAHSPQLATNVCLEVENTGGIPRAGSVIFLADKMPRDKTT